MFKRPKRLEMDTLFQRKKMYIVFILLFLIKTLKSIENDYKMTFGVESYFFRKRDGFP